MKKLIALLLVLTLILSMTACGEKSKTLESAEAPRVEEPTVPPETEPQIKVDEAAKAAAIQTLKNYIVANSMSLSGINYYTVDTGLTDVTCYVLISGDVITLALTYTLGRVSSEKVQFSNQTLLYLTGYEKQQPGTYYAYQRNSSKMGTTEFSLSAGTHLSPETYTTNGALEMVDIEKTENNANAEITDEFAFSMVDGLNVLLEVLADILEDSGSGLTLADFGFVQYEINKNRESEIRSEAWAVS